MRKIILIIVMVSLATPLFSFTGKDLPQAKPVKIEYKSSYDKLKNSYLREKQKNKELQQAYDEAIGKLEYKEVVTQNIYTVVYKEKEVKKDVLGNPVFAIIGFVLGAIAFK